MHISRTLLASLVPDSLGEWALRNIEKFEKGLGESTRKNLNQILTSKPILATQLTKALLGSEYILESCLRDPDLLLHTLLSNATQQPLAPEKITDMVKAACSHTFSEEEFERILRQLRNRFMASLYWRDLNNLADFKEVSQAMTTMAEVFVKQALDYHYQLLCKKHGFPTGKESAQIQPMLVVGMGKLGGEELNVSSDIDLIFAFPEAGGTDHKTKSIDNQQFFIKLGQSLIKTLNGITIDGFVFRVDMRLRPYGQSGNLVSNFRALENYYESQGRGWERFAAIKARVIACTELPDAKQSTDTRKYATKALHKILHPFVYRQYIDFSTIQSLRQLKLMIMKEVHSRSLEDDIKMGDGGIREIEFIAQSFQLIHGGHDPRLQERNLLQTLEKLKVLGYLSEDTTTSLSEAYLFLRSTEHRLQAFRDQQTQTLPADDLSRKRLAWVSNFKSWDDFFQQLQFHRQIVSREFMHVIAEPEDRHPDQTRVSEQWRHFWTDPDGLSDFLVSQGFEQARECGAIVAAFRQSRNVLSLSVHARKNLDELIPVLMQALADYAKQASGDDQTVEEVVLRIFSWLEDIVNRTSYLLLLLENPQIFQHLVKLFAASSWVVETLTQMPSLLDELLYPQVLFSPPKRDALRDELRQRLLRLDGEDREAHMETLRYFRRAHDLQVAACEITDTLPLMKASDHLTFTAEVILEEVLQLAMEDMIALHGYPEGITTATPKFLIVGYGKLGGIEMNYNSDLDLVFIYQTDSDNMSDGKRPLDSQTYFTRLGQKMIHILNVRTLSGYLYQVDMRLRPSGNSGPLVSSLKAFERYQHQDAWIWEHQALVRARPITGNSELATEFNRVRREVLCKKREPTTLKEAVVEMRNKMRQNLGSKASKSGGEGRYGCFHLKQDPGGVVDIEFMVQYMVLAFSHEYPVLARWTDNIRILDSLPDQAFLETQQAERLSEIYQSYRKHKHRLVLQKEDSDLISGNLFVKERQWITNLWRQYLLDRK